MITTSTPQPSELEAEVLRTIAAREPSNSSLRLQIEAATVVSREYSGAGTFLNLAVGNLLPRIEPPNAQIHGPSISTPSVPEGAVSVLFVRNGALAFLEIASCGETWPSVVAEFTLRSEVRPN
jgi:hypothetical protein